MNNIGIKHYSLTLNWKNNSNSDVYMILDTLTQISRNIEEELNLCFFKIKDNNSIASIQKIDYNKMNIAPTFTVYAIKQTEDINFKKEIRERGKMKANPGFHEYITSADSVDYAESMIKKHFYNTFSKTVLAYFYDMSISFRRMSCDDIYDFECTITAVENLFCEENIVIELYKKIIQKFSIKSNLYAAYIDCDNIYEFLEYEYCLNFISGNDEKFTGIRNYSWAGYVSYDILPKSKFKTLEQICYVEYMNNGVYYQSYGEIEQFSYEQRKNILQFFGDVIPKNYGIISINTLLNTNYKPPVDLYLFNGTTEFYIGMSKGIPLFELVKTAKEMFQCSYVRKIIV